MAQASLSAGSRSHLLHAVRPGFGKCGWVNPNERAKTGRSDRKGPSRKGLALNAVPRTQRPSAVAMATVSRLILHDLRHLWLKRAPRIINQRFLKSESLHYEPEKPAKTAGFPAFYGIETCNPQKKDN